MLTPLVDALSLQSGGGNTYLRELVQRPAPGRTHLLITESQWDNLSPDRTSWTAILAPETVRNPLRRQLWRLRNLSALSRRVGADIIFNLACDPCSLPIPQVSMVQNMLPFDARIDRWHPPGSYTNIRLRLLRRRMLNSIQAADGVIFLSNWSRDRITRLLPHPLKCTCVIPHGVTGIPTTTRGIRPRPRVLYVSDFAPYKHQLELALAYDICTARGLGFGGMTFAGSLDDHAYSGMVREQVAHLACRDSVRIPGWLNRKSLSLAYLEADILVIASSVECCPNILLEALATGKPTLCSHEPPMPEFAGDAVVYADPQDPLSLAAGLQHICSLTPAELDAMRGKAQQRSELYDWDRTIAATWNFILETYDRRSKEGFSCAA